MACKMGETYLQLIYYKDIHFLHDCDTCLSHYSHNQAKSLQNAQRNVNSYEKRDLSLVSPCLYVHSC
jgi:hypothetical protein